MRLTKNAKRDASEREIVAALVACGFAVIKLAQKHAPDLVLAKDGDVRIAEVKSGNKKLKPGQEDWWRHWPGHPRLVLCDVEDVAVVAAQWHTDEDLGAQVILHRQARARLKAAG